MDAAAQATKEHPPSGRARERRGGPLDPRLLHYAARPAASSTLAVAIGGVTALLLIAQAWLIAQVVAGAFLDHRSLASLRGPLLALLAVVAGRAAAGLGRRTHRAPGVRLGQVRAPAAPPPNTSPRWGRPVSSATTRDGSARS